ncbi:unnamed protein product [Linum tenue]|uniref:Ycf15 n=1 Tax=Linum tenue TaxID=586396 RepID=A0AAV0IEF1_9ROSI|nr:unnamed protein product [Linum tenue]
MLITRNIYERNFISLINIDRSCNLEFGSVLLLQAPADPIRPQVIIKPRSKNLSPGTEGVGQRQPSNGENLHSGSNSCHCSSFLCCFRLVRFHVWKRIGP